MLPEYPKSLIFWGIMRKEGGMCKDIEKGYFLAIINQKGGFGFV